MNRLADKLASVARVSKTGAVKIALVDALERRESELSLPERLRPIRERIAAYPDTGLEAHQALQACARFGKGRGHPARLNMRDGFA